MNNQGFRPAFKGLVVVPLTDDDDDRQRIKYYGDWQKKRHRITDKPRRYLLTFWFKGFDGERGVEEVMILERCEFLDLADIIKQTGKEFMQAIGEDRINLKASYVSIKA